MRKLLIYLILSGVIGSGCSSQDDSKGVRFLLPWQNSDHQFSLQKIKVKGLAEPHVLDGESAKIYWQTSVSDTGIAGTVARPHFIKNGDHFVAKDAASLISTTVYAHMEKLQRMEQHLGVSSLLPWPRVVIVDVELARNKNGSRDLNNAHYVGFIDAILISPYNGDGWPVAVNGGILGHEHFHAYFYHQVLKPLLNTTPPLEMPTYIEAHKLTSDWDQHWQDSHQKIHIYNSVILNAWNEGLADLWGYIYSGDANYFARSLPKLNKVRSLNNEIKAFASSKDIETTLNEYFSKDKRVERDTQCDPSCIYYSMGSRLARALKKIINVSPQKRDERIRSMMFGLKRLSDYVKVNFSQQKISLTSIVPILLKDIQLNVKECSSLTQLSSSKKDFDTLVRACL